MIKILKYLKKSWAWIILILALLIVQAYCDLSLPQYTSDIVDTGIQQSGIDSCLPEQIRSSEMDKLTLFLEDSEKDELLSAYTADGDVYRLNEIDKDTKASLEELISDPILVVYSLENLDMSASSGEEKMSDEGAAFMAQLSQLPEGTTVFDMLAAAPIEQRIEMKNNMTEKFADYGDSMTSQMSIAYVRSEYEALGIDLDKMQIDYLKTAGGKMIVLSLIMMLTSILCGYLAAKTAAQFGMDIREKVFRKVVSFSNAEMEKFSTASLITRSTNDIQQLQMVIVMLLRMVAYAPILGIGGVIKVINTKTGMGWIIGVSVGAVLALVIILMSVAMPKFKKMQTLVDKLNLVSREILTGLPVIRAFSREKYEEERFDKANTNLMQTQLFTNRVMTFMMPAMMMVMNCVTVLIVWCGGLGIDKGTMQVGDMMAFITYTMQIIMSFLMLTMISVMLPRAAVSANRINEVIETDISISDKENASENAITEGRVCFDDVSFRYGDADADVLEHISFTAEPGQTTAVIGSTGSGKSTLINLIPRFFDVTSGKITVDGTDVRDMSQKHLRSKIGLVPQKGVLFSGTIATNLRFGNKNATDAEIAEAAEIAQATEFIESKPERYETPVAQGGTNVSGGQKQRLSIARAIAKKPKIYIFDDSFSALDFKTDAALRKALSEKLGDSTVLIVAQRISTIINAEKIIVLDDGKIAGIGTHKELMENCDVYRQIAYSQLSEDELNGSKEVE